MKFFIITSLLSHHEIIQIKRTDIALAECIPGIFGQKTSLAGLF